MKYKLIIVFVFLVSCAQKEQPITRPIFKNGYVCKKIYPNKILVEGDTLTSCKFYQNLKLERPYQFVLEGDSIAQFWLDRETEALSYER